VLDGVVHVRHNGICPAARPTKARPMLPTAARVQSLDHVTIVVRDLAATRRFYVDLLGMEEVARPGFSFSGQWFQAGATMIHTILEYEGSGRAGSGGENNTRGHHFAFLVPDAKAAAAHLEAHGVPFVSPPKLRPDGAVQTFVHDPDGHLVELSSLPK
jgi:catechol 2,3-dioxygenase-like lactoylglutathione lyase family enzyme